MSRKRFPNWDVNLNVGVYFLDYVFLSLPTHKFFFKGLLKSGSLSEATIYIQRRIRVILPGMKLEKILTNRSKLFNDAIYSAALIYCGQIMRK